MQSFLNNGWKRSTLKEGWNNKIFTHTEHAFELNFLAIGFALNHREKVEEPNTWSSDKTLVDE